MSFKFKLATLGVAIALTACSSVQMNEGNDAAITPTPGSEFAQFLSSRPKVGSVAIGDHDTDMAFKAVAGIYDKAMKLADSYMQKTELSKYSQLSELSTTDSEAYRARYAQLSERERAEYGQFLNSTSDVTAQAMTLLMEAYQLKDNLQAIDVTKLISSPLKLPAAAEGASRATDQIQLAVDALSMLQKYHGMYSTAKNQTGQ